MITIPSYEEALERHETPLDVFISRWEPVDSRSYKKGFREDLAALIAYIEAARQGAQSDMLKHEHIPQEFEYICAGCGRSRAYR